MSKLEIASLKEISLAKKPCIKCRKLHKKGRYTYIDVYKIK